MGNVEHALTVPDETYIDIYARADGQTTALCIRMRHRAWLTVKEAGNINSTNSCH